MADIIVQTGDGQNSPFDAIRRVDNHGNEYWLARELMLMLGYRQWRQFAGCIEIAISNVSLGGDNPSDHFLRTVAKSKGRDGEDYQLSRYGCYHAALACDGRKPEVAAAKKYFVVRTREAEIFNPNYLNSEVSLIGQAIDVAFSGVGLNPALVAGCKLNAIEAMYPQLNPSLNEGRKVLAATNKIEDQLLTPTDIGKRLGVSAREVNTRLIRAGLQRKNDSKSKGSPAYLPTDRGHEFCDLTIATGKQSDNTSYQHLKWYPSVLSVLE